MRLIAVLATVSIVCLCAAPATAGEWSLEKWAQQESAWKGHGVGSSVTQTTTVPMPKMPNMPDVPGMPKDGKMVTTTKTTLTKITKDGYVLTVATTSMGNTSTTTRTEPKVRKVRLAGQIKEAGEEAVTVQGKSYTCKVKTVSNMGDLLGDSLDQGGPGGGGAPQVQKGKVWEHPTQGVLKMETTTSAGGQAGKMTWQVTRLTANYVLGKTTYAGREMLMTSAGQMGNAKVTVITSNTVPGGTLKSVAEMAMMGRKTKVTTVLTAYTKKPLTATTPAVK